MKDIIKMVVNLLWHDKYKGILLVSCLSLGTIGTISMCQANRVLYDYNSYQKFTNFENAMVIEVSNSMKISQKLMDLNFDLDFKKSNDTFSGLFKKNELYGTNSQTSSTIYMIDLAHYNSLQKGYPIIGKWFQTYQECVIGNDIAYKNNIKIGSQIAVDANTFTVVGILNLPYYESAMLIPIK